VAQRFYVWGEVDLATAPELEKDLLVAIDVTRGDLIIDCRDLSFIDSSGIQVLMRTRDRLFDQGRDLRLTRVHPRMRQALEKLELADLVRDDLFSRFTRT
jgi:anti-anti-sigma factor